LEKFPPLTSIVAEISGIFLISIAGNEKMNKRIQQQECNQNTKEKCFLFTHNPFSWCIVGGCWFTLAHWQHRAHLGPTNWLLI
jgi:hypothetical protein